MYFVNKISQGEPIDFAASELKKYLRMMMPECGDVKISYAPDAKDGFRIGLMQDFGLDTSDVRDTFLDDIIFIDCDEHGGVIAGDNPRSVLIAVYEFLKKNGCLWLYPGADGEYIPITDIKPVRLRHVPTMRYRGYAAEGSVFHDAVTDFIDFMPKLGLNTYMIEFRVPRTYYEFHYKHLRNERNRPEEPISDDQVMQWKREAECEIAKRGLHFHDIGHGWTVDPFGIDAKYAWDQIDESLVPADMIQYLAEIGGKRGLFDKSPANTQFCMSNPKARELFANFVAKYAEEHPTIDFLHVWLADNVNNHCECEECKKKIPSDYYMILMNDIDKALTKKGLDTKIVFIAYLDTIFPPEIEKVDNPSRFLLLFAPISRCYSVSGTEETEKLPLLPYARNKIKGPKSLSHSLNYFDGWKKNFHGDAVAFEYHFWRHLSYDMTGLQIAKRIWEDADYYKKRGIDGFIENGTLHSFFPNGIAFYTYARVLYDASVPFDAIAEEYFSHIYGADYKEFIQYLEDINKIFPYDTFSTNTTEKMKTSLDIPETYVAVLDSLENILKNGEALIASHYNSPFRVQTVSVRLLEWHIRYMRGLTPAFKEKARGNDDAALKLFEEFQYEFGKNEVYIQRYFDHLLIFSGLTHLFKIKNNPLITD